MTIVIVLTNGGRRGFDRTFPFATRGARIIRYTRLPRARAEIRDWRAPTRNLNVYGELVLSSLPVPVCKLFYVFSIL